MSSAASPARFFGSPASFAFSSIRGMLRLKVDRYARDVHGYRCIVKRVRQLHL